MKTIQFMFIFFAQNDPPQIEFRPYRAIKFREAQVLFSFLQLFFQFDFEFTAQNQQFQTQLQFGLPFLKICDPETSSFRLRLI